MKTKQIIDISLPVSEGMPKHPAAYLSGVTIKQVANHKIHKRSIQSLTISTHVSTHIDAPFHTRPDGLTVENIPYDLKQQLSNQLNLCGHRTSS